MELGQTLQLPQAPSGLRGRIRVPPSKSLAQRYLLAASLAGPPAQVEQFSPAEDPQLLLQALQELGYGFAVAGPTVRVQGLAERGGATLFFGNNGTGLRLLLAQLAAIPGRWVVDGVPRLRERPLGGLLAALRQLGAVVEGERLPLVVHGRLLAGGRVRLDASQSSQFVSALMFLGVRLPLGLEVELAGVVPSWPYVTLSAAVLQAFGAQVELSPSRLRVAGPLRPRTVAVEGDWSAAAFPLVGVAVAGGAVEVLGVDATSPQGDLAIVQLLRQAGCQVEERPEGVWIEGPGRRPLRGNLANVPDLFPPLAVYVALRGGKLEGLGHLAYKESPRVEVMARHLSALGLDVGADGDSFWGSGTPTAPRAPAEPLSPYGDHRIAMALAVAGLVTPGLQLSEPVCVAKSWPEFFRSWLQLIAAAG
ncbi:MAG: 3-phosphoshikimate 1-carboxyvinyltransferase [Thermoanaerobaculum sp.]|nr:3-phosphoshikimate 1-carboxyvinyltransferase [Thermoanaerobaculum sp.]